MKLSKRESRVVVVSHWLEATVAATFQKRKPDGFFAVRSDPSNHFLVAYCALFELNWTNGEVSETGAVDDEINRVGVIEVQNDQLILNQAVSLQYGVDFEARIRRNKMVKRVTITEARKLVIRW